MCDTPNLALKNIDRLLISTRFIFFHRSPFAKHSTIKRAWWGVILGWVTSYEVFLGAHKWGQSALERFVLICEASLQSPWVVTSGPFDRGVTMGIRATLRPWLIVCSVHLAGEIDLETTVQRGHCIPKWGECDTSNLALTKNNRLLISTRCIFFLWEPIW